MSVTDDNSPTDALTENAEGSTPAPQTVKLAQPVVYVMPDGGFRDEHCAAIVTRVYTEKVTTKVDGKDVTTSTDHIDLSVYQRWHHVWRAVEKLSPVPGPVSGDAARGTWHFA